MAVISQAWNVVPRFWSFMEIAWTAALNLARHTSSKPLMLAGLGEHSVAGTLCSLFTLFSYQSGAQMANNYFSVCSLLLANYQRALRFV